MERTDNIVKVTLDELHDINAKFTTDCMSSVENKDIVTILITSSLAHDAFIKSIKQLNELDENSTSRNIIITLKKEDAYKVVGFLEENIKDNTKALREKSSNGSAVIPILLIKGLALSMYYNLMDKLFNENEQPKEEQQ